MAISKIKLLLYILFFTVFNVHSQENIVQGPFKLKGADKAFIRYVRNSDESISLIVQKKEKDRVVGSYELGDGVPNIETVFFTNILNASCIVTLVSWDESNVNSIHYKVYVYTYYNDGVILLNKKVTSDKNLEGYDGYNGSGSVFELKKSNAIKGYLKGKYGK